MYYAYIVVMTLFTTQEFAKNIKNKILNSKTIELFSAYIKLNALKIITDDINEKSELTLVARWQPHDLCSKASDLEVYEYCKLKGWKFGIDTTLHQKLYIFDRNYILLGSNNITLSGLGLIPSHNTEAGTFIEPDIKDFDKIDLVYKNVTWMDDAIYSKIKDIIKNTPVSDEKMQWPEEIKKILYKPIEGLWSYEFPLIAPEVCESSDTNNEFYNSKVYLWLLEILKNNDPKQYTNFGWLTSQIHNILLDNPVPQRADVKELTKILFKYIEQYSNDIRIIKFKNTKQMELKS